MKPLLRSLAIAASLLFTGAAIAEETKAPTWLFVQTAETAEVASEDTLVMPVTNINLCVYRMIHKKVCHINAHEFVAFWDEGGMFKADPPNAVITWVDAEEKVHEAEVILTGAEVRMQGRAIAYEVGEQGAQTLVLGSIIGVSLFIDSLVCPPHTLGWEKACQQNNYNF